MSNPTTTPTAPTTPVTAPVQASGSLITVTPTGAIVISPKVVNGAKQVASVIGKAAPFIAGAAVGAWNAKKNLPQDPGFLRSVLPEGWFWAPSK